MQILSNPIPISALNVRELSPKFSHHNYYIRKSG